MEEDILLLALTDASPEPETCTMVFNVTNPLASKSPEPDTFTAELSARPDNFTSPEPDIPLSRFFTSTFPYRSPEPDTLNFNELVRMPSLKKTSPEPETPMLFKSLAIT